MDVKIKHSHLFQYYADSIVHKKNKTAFFYHKKNEL